MPTSILITGAHGNLGKVVVQKVQKANYRIVATVSEEEHIAALSKENIAVKAVDLTDEKAVQSYVQNIQHPEQLEAAVLTVGGFAAGGFASTDGAALKKMYSLNFETAYFLVKELLPVFEQNGGGQFILFGTRPALEADGGKDLLAYAFSKALIFKLSEFINAYGSDKNIHSTVIVPSTIDTPTNRAAMPKADFSKWVSAEAIADTILFLLTGSGRQIREGVLKLYNEA